MNLNKSTSLAVSNASQYCGMQRQEAQLSPGSPTVLPGNVPYFLEGGGARGPDPYFGEAGVRSGSAMVPLDRAHATLVSSYRLSIVTMSLTEAVWPKFAMHVFGDAVSRPTRVWEKWGDVGGPNWYRGVAAGNIICSFRQFFG